jgi:hypothetical protein
MTLRQSCAGPLETVPNNFLGVGQVFIQEFGRGVAELAL